MRLKPHDISVIKSILLENIADAKIFLFGSRIDDSKRGGDIDLFIQTGIDITLKDELKILALMEMRGIRRKIDLIIQTPFKQHQNIFDTAKSRGILL